VAVHLVPNAVILRGYKRIKKKLDEKKAIPIEWNGDENNENEKFG
jgi:hypothetical protein